MMNWNHVVIRVVFPPRVSVAGIHTREVLDSQRQVLFRTRQAGIEAVRAMTSVADARGEIIHLHLRDRSSELLHPHVRAVVLMLV